MPAIPRISTSRFRTQSYARGPARPLLELTIGDLLQRTADRFPDRLAVASRHQEKRLTWAELSAEADRVARGLWSLGIRRGDRVGLWSTNCIEWIMMHMGCARAGAALVNVNPAYRSHELQFTLDALADEGAVSVAQGQARRLRGDPGPRAARARPGARTHHLLRLAGVAGAARRRRPAARSRGRRRCGQHPVHQRHHRPAQGRDAHAPQRGEQRAVPGAGISLHRAGQDRCSGAALPLLRLRHRHHERGQLRRGHHPAQLDLRRRAPR